jgi:acyl-CoA synthetase (AMP-forming)/AMP-acid ligase II/acyl carrier protein
MRYLLDGERESHVVSFGDLETHAINVAHQLLQKVRPGDRVLLLFPPGIEFLYGFLGCLYAGVIAVPAYPSKSGRRSHNVDLIKKNSDAKLILTSEKQHALELDLAAKDADEVIIISENPSDRSLAGRRSVLPKVSRDDIAFLQYTSGSTSAPKGVVVTHSNIMANMAMIAKGYQTSEKSRFVSWLPVFHDMGLIGCTLHPLYMGCEVVQMPPVAFLEKPIRWLQAIHKYRATISGAPNFAFDYCLRKISEDDVKDLDLSTLQLLFNGAEPVRAESLRKFYGRFAINGLHKTALRPTYGLAEATLLVAGGPSASEWISLKIDKADMEAGKVRTTTIGDYREIVGCGEASLQEGLLIIDPDTAAVCPPDRIGEIWLKGANIATGYWHHPEDSDQVFGATPKNAPLPPGSQLSDTVGYLRSGDLGFIKDSQLFVCGRVKDLIIVGGRNIYPHDVEAVAEKAVKLLRPGSSAAFALEGAQGEEIVLVAELDRSALKDEKTASVGGLAVYLEELMGAIGKEFSVSLGAVVLIKPGTLPKTTSGKVQRRETRQRFLQKTLDPVFSWIAPRLKDLLQTNKDRLDPQVQQVTFQNNPVPFEPPEGPNERGVENLPSRTHHDAETLLTPKIYDERGLFPPRVILDFGNQGLLCMLVPKAYGGKGLTLAQGITVLQQLAEVDFRPSLGSDAGVWIDSFKGAIGNLQFKVVEPQTAVDPLKKNSLPSNPSEPRPATVLPFKTTTSENLANIESHLLDWLAKNLIIDRATLAPDKTMANFGLDSVVAVELRVYIESWLKVSVPEGSPWEYPTVRQFAAFLAETVNQKSLKAS